MNQNQEGKIKKSFKNRETLFLIFSISILIINCYFLSAEFFGLPSALSTLKPYAVNLFNFEDLFNQKFSAISSDFFIDLKLMQKVSDLRFDLSFLKDQKFVNLVKYGQFPVVVREKGRSNPFEPY